MHENFEMTELGNSAPYFWQIGCCHLADPWSILTVHLER